MATTQEKIVGLYAAFFNRAPDKAGFDEWVTKLDADTATLNDIAAGFAQHDTFTSTYGAMDDQAFVEAIYQNVLGQAGDATGVANQVAALSDGTYATRADFVSGFVESALEIDLTADLGLTAEELAAATARQDTLQNKVDAGQYFMTTWGDATNVGDAANPEADANYIASIAALNGIDDTAASVTAAEANIDAMALTAPAEPVVPGAPQNLTVNQDNLTGTALNDTFTAHIFDNQNTAQSGDMIDGAGGTDRLEVDIGNSQEFAISLDTTSVEQFAVRAQADNNNDALDTQDDSDNNMNNNVQIDAERMEGTIWYESNNSRADVVIEDVRIERVLDYADSTNQITRDVTIAMVSTDPGDVDLDVYFDDHSLVKQADNTSNSVTLTIGNQIEAADFDAAAPLKDVPYTNVTFTVDGTDVTLDLDLTAVNTYAEMAVAFQASFDAEKLTNPLLANVTYALSTASDSFLARDGSPRTADEYVLSVSDGTIAQAVTGWNADGGLPSNNAFSARVEAGDATISSNLITSTVVLDDVGRGSMGGDLVIGNLSTGETSDSKGVEQFDIFVDRNSELQNITSTDNTLQEVYVVNRDHFADLDNTATGSLTVTGVTDNDDSGVVGDAGDYDDEDGNVATVDGYGFNDLRIFDASTMVGEVNINAILSDAVVTKYLDLDDTAADVTADNVMFEYNLGTNNDTLALDMSSFNLEVAGTETREDFNLMIQGNAGDDSITTQIGTWPAGVFTLTAANEGTNWYENSKENANLAIDAGTGNDMIATIGAGDFVIDAGSGDDTVYANNDGINPVASPATNEIQTLTFGATGDLNTQGQVTVALSNGQSFTTVGLTTVGAGTSSNVDVATAVVTAHTLAEAAAITALGAATGAAAGLVAAAIGAVNTPGAAAALALVANDTTAQAALVAAANAAVGTPGAAAANAAVATNAALITSTTTIANDYAATVLVQSGNQVAITYGADYSGPEDVGAAVISDIATDSTYTIGAVLSGTGTASTLAAGTNEVITIATTTDALAGDTLTFNDGTPVLVLVDTDGNGTVSPFEITQQLAATTFTLFDVTASNPSLGTVTLTAKAQLAPSGFTVVDSGLSDATPTVITPGVAPVAETGTGGSTQAFTVDIGADRTGSVTLVIDTDLDGVGETYNIPVTTGDESVVATQIATFISGLTGMTAVATDAGGTSTVTMTFAAIGNAAAHTIATAITDGAIVSSSVVETVKGIEADGADNATWVVNATNTDITDLDSAGTGAQALLYGAQLTVTYSGATIVGESGVTAGAAVANSNGFESTVTIGTQANLANHTEINQAIKDAIIGDGAEGGLQGTGNVLEELLKVNDGPANTIVIESLIDGQFNVNDLAITITAATFANLSTAEQTALRITQQDIDNDSTATYTDAQMQAFLDAAVAVYAAGGALNNVAQGTTAAGLLLRGEASNSVSDNTITLGTGDDVVVLGTDDQSNDTLVYSGTFGNDTVVNFTETGAAADMLDFSSYLKSETSASGSAASTVATAITFNADGELSSNEVHIINNFANYGTTATVAQITAGLTVENLVNPVGTTYHSIVMTENGANDGEYLVYDVLATDNAASFTSATLIGSIDFGDTLTGVTDATFA